MRPNESSHPAFFLLPDSMPPLDGPERIALHSFFRLICETNQLKITELAEIAGPDLYGGTGRRATNIVMDMEAVNAGRGQSERMAKFIEAATGFSKGLNLTMHEIDAIPGMNHLVYAQHGRWCAACFQDDADNGTLVYERLLWNIRLVSCCRIHMTPLSNSCPKCGRERKALLFGREVSGYCHSCFHWLGHREICERPHSDWWRYSVWVSQSFADLLTGRIEVDGDVRRNFAVSLRAVCDMHHKGVMLHLAKHIRRASSQLSTWLEQRIRISWEVLVCISYVYQIPVLDLLNGDVPQLWLLPHPRVLPLEVKGKHPVPRRARRKRKTANEIKSYLENVISGAFDDVVTLQGAADRFGVDAREFYAFALEETRRASRVLAERRRAQAQRKKADDELRLKAAVVEIVDALIASKSRPTRELVVAETKRRGFVIGWPRLSLINTLMRERIAKRAATHDAESKASCR